MPHFFQDRRGKSKIKETKIEYGISLGLSSNSWKIDNLYTKNFLPD